MFSLYDELRSQARSLGDREVDFTFEYPTDEKHLNLDMVIEEIENKYGPRDGPPTGVRMEFLGARGTGRYTERQVEVAIMTIRVRAKINRFVFHGDPTKDRVDQVGVTP